MFKTWVRFLPHCFVVWLAKRDCERLTVWGEVVVQPFADTIIRLETKKETK